MTRVELEFALRDYQAPAGAAEHEVAEGLRAYLRPMLPAGLLIVDVVPSSEGLDLLLAGGAALRVSMDFDWAAGRVGERVIIGEPEPV